MGTVRDHRLQVRFSKESLDDLDSIKEAIGAPTRTAVIRSALELVHLLVTAKARGDEITILLKRDENIDAQIVEVPGITCPSPGIRVIG